MGIRERLQRRRVGSTWAFGVTFVTFFVFGIVWAVLYYGGILTFITFDNTYYSSAFSGVLNAPFLVIQAVCAWWPFIVLFALTMWNIQQANRRE